MCRLLSAWVVLFLFALPARADAVKVAETYWQRLPGAGWVDFDPVFHLEHGYYFAKTGAFVKYRDGAPNVPTYFDRAGRVWVRDTDAVHLWNGSKWEKLDHHPVRLFDDSAGRVFLFDGKNVRVLGTDGKWAVEAITKNRHSEGVNFVESGKRVWLWGSRELPGARTGCSACGVTRTASGRTTTPRPGCRSTR